MLDSARLPDHWEALLSALVVYEHQHEVICRLWSDWTTLSSHSISSSHPVSCLVLVGTRLHRLPTAQTLRSGLASITRCTGGYALVGSSYHLCDFRLVILATFRMAIPAPFLALSTALCPTGAI